MKSKAWIGRLILVGEAVLQVALFALLCVIFNNANKLRYFFLPTLLLLLGVMLYILARFLKKHELEHLRLQLGDELFFRKFPKEKKREMRRLEREKKREERRLKKHSEKKYPHEL